MQVTPNLTWPPSNRQRLLLAALVPVGAGGLQWLCWGFLQPYVWFLFFPAVFFSSWIGGKRGGLVSTALSMGLVWYFFMPPQFSFALEQPRELISMGMFAGMGILFSFFHERLRQVNRQLAATAARQGEEHFRALFERSLDCVFLTDFEGRFLDANPAALALLGYQQEDISRLTFAALLSADQLPRAMQVTAEIQATGSQKERQEFRLRGKDGREVDVEVRSALIYRAGQPYAIQGIARDITARKQTEAALRLSEEQFRAMFEGASIGMAQADPQTRRWVRANQKMCAITGYSEPEMLQMQIQDITHPEDREADTEAFRRVIAGQASDQHIEKRYLRKDGTVTWVNLNMTVIRDAAGVPVRTIATIEEITERRQAVAALRENQAKFSRMFESSPVATSLSTVSEGRYLDVNAAFLKMFQRSRAEVVGHTVYELNVWMDLEQRKRLLAELQAKGEVHNFEMQLRGKSGQVMDI